MDSIQEITHSPEFGQLIVQRWNSVMKYQDPLPRFTGLSPALLTDMDQHQVYISGSLITLAEVNGAITYRIIGWDDQYGVLVLSLEHDLRKKPAQEIMQASRMVEVLTAAGYATEVIAETPHGSYQFDIVGIENVEGMPSRVKLALKERDKND